jgi:hypothetical protein
VVRIAEGILARRVSLLCGFAIPTNRLSVILRNPFASGVSRAKSVLGSGASGVSFLDEFGSIYGNHLSGDRENKQDREKPQKKTAITTHRGTSWHFRSRKINRFTRNTGDPFEPSFSLNGSVAQAQQDPQRVLAADLMFKFESRKKFWWRRGELNGISIYVISKLQILNNCKTVQTIKK